MAEFGKRCLFGVSTLGLGWLGLGWLGMAAAPVAAEPAAVPNAPHLAALPPAPPWSGATRQLMLPADSQDPFLTPFERSGGLDSPNYAETIAWLRRLALQAPELDLVSLGRSAEGREIWMVVATRSSAKTPEALAASQKPVVLVQAGIHSGEIDGKDAGMMLLRDMTVGGKLGHLLDAVHLLFVPIFNVDGHERSSAYGRINQRGPRYTGWRTTATNLNLNRDYAKADSPEMRAMLAAINRWQPALYLDVHVTDGVDYQYDITWGYGGEKSYSPQISRFLAESFDPPIQKVMREAGHSPGYLVFSLDSEHPDRGYLKWQNAPPRFSDAYGAARHLPTILVENHSLKPFDQRVLGTYVFLREVLAQVGRQAAALAEATRQDRATRRPVLPLRFEPDFAAEPVAVEMAGISWEERDSPVAGRTVVWTGKPVQQVVPRTEAVKVLAEARRPKAYLVPPAHTEVIARLAAHGIQMEVMAAGETREVELYRLQGWALADAPFEGRVGVRLTEKPTQLRRKLNFPPGTVRVSTDQPLGDLAMLLLEPESEDSLFQWGFFLGMLNATEYVEPYVMVPMAEKMLADDPALAAEFTRRLEDPAFAGDPQARLRFFYERTPYFDDHFLLYPVARELD